MIKFLAYGQTDTGLKRTNNEDMFVVDRELGLFLVADGMGGAAAGEVASRIFAETTLSVFKNATRHTLDETAELIYRSFGLANESILNHIEQNPEHKGMGCTAEVLSLFGNGFVLGHIGDSRTYRLRNGKFVALTKDHSFVQMQLDQGLITSDEARKHAMKHVILRAVGITDQLSLDIFRGELLHGDLFLLCSDGMTDMVEDEKIHEILSSAQDLSRKGNRLIEAAKDAGGYDNITIVLVQII